MVRFFIFFIKKVLFVVGWRLLPSDAVVISKKIVLTHSRLKRRWLLYLKNKIFLKYKLEIETPNIGKNFVMGHPYGITINARAVIGNDCVVFKNATIGSIRSGKREGVPVLGDKVVVGCGAFLCGGIRIGNDVLIAANSFVDFDVPDHSIVIGNPGIIHHKENSSKDYVK